MLLLSIYSVSIFTATVHVFTNDGFNVFFCAVQVEMGCSYCILTTFLCSLFVLDSINILPCVTHSELNSNIININNLFISYCQRLVQIMTQSLAIHCFALLCCIVNMKCFVHCCQAQRNM